MNIRDYTLERHGKVDNHPHGGGAGMVMQAEPIYRAYAALVEKIGKKPRVIYMTPQGQTFNQSIAEDLAKEEDLVFLCGHYEGVDERVLEMIATDYLSAGDYVLTGGELPAMMMIDCISRLVPGVLNNNVSAEFETFHDNLLEYPQYTRPEVFMGKKVPDILLSGHHANVEKWRREQSIIRTLKNRPELLEDAVLSKKEQKFLDELLRQQELENAQKVKNKEKASAEHDGKRPPDPCSWKNETFAPQILVTVQPLHLLVFIFMKTRSLVPPPYADLDEKVLMQSKLVTHFLIQTSAWLNCNKYCAILENRLHFG